MAMEGATGVDLSVAICTWNRARPLEVALDSVAAALERASSRVEIIVVNNNCTDDTDALLDAMAQRLPIRRVFEPKPGLSNARNAAVMAAQGDYILWTDDDVIVDAEWIRAYETTIREHPEAAFLGGPIELAFEGRPPRWLEAALPQIEQIYAARDLGRSAQAIAQPRDLPFGANYAVRTRDQRSILYDARLGRQPGNYWLAAEETTLLGRLLQGGATGWWVPDAAVVHRIPRDRQSIAYLVKHGLGQGSTVQRLRPSPGNRARLFGRPVWLWREVFSASAECLRARLFEAPAVWVPSLHRACVLAGQLREIRQ